VHSLQQKIEARLYWATFFGALTLYALFPSFLHNFDGVACAIAVELSDKQHLVHGNHLLYGVAGWLFHQLLGLTGLKISALFALKLFDMLLGAGGAALLHRTLKRAHFAEPIPMTCAAGLAVSYGYWLWSLEVQVYALGAFFLICVLQEALRDKPSPHRLALWHGLAMLTHGANVLLTPVVLYALWRANEDATKLRRAVGRYLVLAAAMVIIVYAAAIAWWVGAEDWAALKTWLLGSAALGPGRSFNFITGNLFANLRHWVIGSGEAVSPWAWLGLPLWLAAMWVLPHREGEDRRLALTAWLWLPAYALLFTQWQPGVLVYRVSDLIPLWLLAAVAAQRLPKKWRRLLPAYVAVLFAVNLAVGIGRWSDPQANNKLQDAYWMSAATPENAWIAAIGRDEVYYPYFAHRRTLNLRWYDGQPQRLAQRIATILEESPLYITSERLNNTPYFPKTVSLRIAGKRGDTVLLEITGIAQ
jgi:hypothetical protein